MALRTTRSEVTFLAPFTLAELDEPQPAGSYQVETDEDIIEGNERTVYVRVATLLYLERSGTTTVVTINPDGLRDALARDSILAAAEADPSNREDLRA